MVFILFLPFFMQDPTNLDKFNVSNFFHVKNNLKVLDPGKKFVTETYFHFMSGVRIKL